MKATEAKVTQRVMRRAFAPQAVLLISLLITLLVSLYVYRSSQARNQALFNNSVQDLITFVRGRPRLFVEVLRAGTGLFAANPEIDPIAFHRFIDRLELAEQYPGAQGIGFLARGKPGSTHAIQS